MTPRQKTKMPFGRFPNLTLDDPVIPDFYIEGLYLSSSIPLQAWPYKAPACEYAHWFNNEAQQKRIEPALQLEIPAELTALASEIFEVGHSELAKRAETNARRYWELMGALNRLSADLQRQLQRGKK